MAQISFRIVGNPKSSGSLKTLLLKGEPLDEGMFKTQPFPADCSARVGYAMKTYRDVASYCLIVNPAYMTGPNGELTLWVYIPRGYELTKDGEAVSPKAVVDELFGCFCSTFMGLTPSDKWKYLELNEFQNKKPDFVAIVNKYRLEAKPEKYVVMGGGVSYSVVADESKIAAIMSDPGYDVFAGMDRLFFYLQGTPSNAISLEVPRPRVPGEASVQAPAESVTAPTWSPSPAPVLGIEDKPANHDATPPPAAESEENEPESKKSPIPEFLHNRKLLYLAGLVAMLLIGIWIGKMISGQEKVSDNTETAITHPIHVVPDTTSVDILPASHAPIPVETIKADTPTPMQPNINKDKNYWLKKIKNLEITFAEVDECLKWANDNNDAELKKYIKQVKEVRDFLQELHIMSASDAKDKANEIGENLDAFNRQNSIALIKYKSEILNRIKNLMYGDLDVKIESLRNKPIGSFSQAVNLLKK